MVNLGSHWISKQKAKVDPWSMRISRLCGICGSLIPYESRSFGSDLGIHFFDSSTFLTPIQWTFVVDYVVCIKIHFSLLSICLGPRIIPFGAGCVPVKYCLNRLWFAGATWRLSITIILQRHHHQKSGTIQLISHAISTAYKPYTHPLLYLTSNQVFASVI